MNQVISGILKEYELDQQKNAKKLENKRNQIYEQYPELSEFESKIGEINSQIILEKLKSNANNSNSKNEVLDDFPLENINSKLHKLNEQLSKYIVEKEEYISKNNIPINELTIEYKCSKCKDTGYLNQNGKREKCSCFIQKIIEQNYNQSNLKDMQLKTFDNFKLDYYQDEAAKNDAKKALEYAKKYVEEFKSGSNSVLFCGQTGLGKTHLCEAIAREVINKGYTVFYQTSPNIFSKLMEYKVSDISKYNQMSEFLETIDLLVIDDFGTENLTDSRKEELFTILNCRINYNRPIIISTNLLPNELSTKYTDRIVSRIIGNFDMYRLSGKDIRALKKKLG